MFDLKQTLESRRGDGLDLLEAHINPAMAKVLRIIGYDVNYVRGQGAYLWDDKGNRYIDCLGGYAVLNVGRNHPVVREALKQAMDLDLPNLVKMGIPKLSGILAEQLIELAPHGLDTVFFTNSGAEGVETALKYARAATGRSRIVHCTKSFHGLTLGSLSVNGGGEFRDGFGTLLESMQAPFNDLAALDAALSRREAAAFIVEPIQGKGVQIATPEYFRGAAELCRKYGTIFIDDEVQTGFGRTGTWFACEHYGVEPDIMVTAKALSGGYVPVGAVLSRRAIHDKVFSSMDRCMVHSTTFGQNDLAMAAGLATLAVIREEKLVENAARMGDLLMSKLRALMPKYEMLKDVRGKGLMIAVEFGPPSSLQLKMGWSLLHKLDASLFPQAILIPLLTDHRILAQVAGHHIDVIKLIPPLVLNEQDVDEIARAFDAVIGACHRFPGPIWEVGKRMTEHAVKGR